MASRFRELCRMVFCEVDVRSSLGYANNHAYMKAYTQRFISQVNRGFV